MDCLLQRVRSQDAVRACSKGKPRTYVLGILLQASNQAHNGKITTTVLYGTEVVWFRPGAHGIIEDNIFSFSTTVNKKQKKLHVKKHRSNKAPTFPANRTITAPLYMWCGLLTFLICVCFGYLPPAHSCRCRRTPWSLP